MRKLVLAFAVVAIAAIFASTANAWVVVPPTHYYAYDCLNNHEVTFTAYSQRDANGEAALALFIYEHVFKHNPAYAGHCVTSTPTVNDVDTVFLCTTGAFPTLVVVSGWANQVADLASGYVNANAHSGNVEGGNNIGAYHVDCVAGANSSVSPGANVIDDSGELFPNNGLSSWPGWYPVVS